VGDFKLQHVAGFAGGTSSASSAVPRNYLAVIVGQRAKPTRTTRRWSLPKRKEPPSHDGGHEGSQYPDTKKPPGEPEGF